MKKFVFQLILFALPVLLYVSVPAYVLLRSRESFYNPEAEILSDKPYRIGYAYNESNYAWIKWKVFSQSDRKNVIALGSSRVLQFRSEMFSDSFYNTGYTVSGIRDFVPFLKSIPKNKYPKYLIISLDQWMFNANWDNFSAKIDNDRWKNSFSKNANLSVMNNVWKDLFAGKYGLKIHPTDRNINYIGLNAIVNQKGFRNDGSMDYGRQITGLLKDTTGHYNDSYDRITSGTNRFQYAEHINQAAVSETEKLLRFCKKNNIKVVAFLPPFGDSVYQKMSDLGKYGYLDEIFPAINPLFKKYGFELYDFSTASKCGSDDSETIDGFHGGELTTAKMLVKMLESGSALNAVSDLKKLQTDIKNPVNRYTVYK